MQVDGTTYGIIPDTFNTILSNYLNPLQNTFPNATSINSPIYALAYVIATQDQLLQAALTSLWNAINANTSQGLGLDILASTVLNLTRNALIPSSCGITVTLGPIYSTVQIQITVTAVGGSPPYYIPNGWEVSGTVSPSPAYEYDGPNFAIGSTGVYYLTLQSTDTTTAVPASAFNSGTAVSGLTFTVTNPAPANVGTFTIPTTWQVTASSLGSNSPVYSPNSPETFTSAGTYNFIVYSQDINTPINPTQLNSPSSNFNGIITNVTNQYAAILGVPPETDAEFSARRRYYLNVEGQTYYGMEKAILDLQIPALQSVFIAETISQSSNYSILIIQITVVVSSGPVVIPNGWKVYGSTTPSPAYATLQAYSFPASGTYYIPTYSTDGTTSVAAGTITTADPPYPSGGVTGVTNLDPAIFGNSLVPNGLGQRGYTVYLEYPILTTTSYVVIQLDVTAVGGSPPYYIPTGWTVSGTVSPSPPYVYNGPNVLVDIPHFYYVVLESTDVSTVVPASAFNSGTAIPGLTFTVTNNAAAVLGGGFDVNDLYLQQIAETCYAYHPLGTQFYAGGAGATTFTVNTPYSGYTYDVILNPFQTSQITCNLQFVYNTDANDAGFSNGVFDTTLLPTLQTQMQEIINQYFLSKTLPTDLVYSINELSIIIQNTFTGVVALVGNSHGRFTFGTVSPSSSDLVYLRRLIGYNYNLSITNFNFTAVNKDSYLP